MPYRKATFYYLTGTGNSYRIASLMKASARKQAVPSEIAPIDKIVSTPPSEADELIGFTLPTHGFTAPWPMLKFVWRMPPGNGAHAVVTPTRAGTKIGAVCLPGMEGTAGYLLALILVVKGYLVRGVTGIDMPSNWIALHWGLHPKNVQVIIERAQIKTEGFMEYILAGDQRFPWGSFLQLFFGLLLLPISLGYMLMGRFFLAKLFFADYRCNGCGLCAEHCPHQAIKMYGKDHPRPYWTYRCESCMRCMGFCPQEAVESGHSFAVLLYFVTTVPVDLYFLNWLGGLIPGLKALNQGWLRILIQYPYILLSMALAYFVFVLVLRIPLVNRIFTYTTLTRIYRRYHEPESKVKDLKG